MKQVKDEDRATHLSPADAAHRLSVSEDFIRRLCRTGELDCARLGRLVRIPVASLDAYVAARTVHGRQPRAILPLPPIPPVRPETRPPRTRHPRPQVDPRVVALMADARARGLAPLLGR
ncbi:MAG: helix-turn-helix domain-containing protein [Candidatus Limnocylindrales bacterium]|jgi:excisionase family DNA binding protein